MKLNVRAYAKINWSLSVTRTRPDGYHALDGLMQTIDLCDELTVESAGALTLAVDGTAAEPDNLVLKAARALAEHSGIRAGARMALTKRIPARAGLGGGSADAAAALIALNRLWSLNLPLDVLMELGLRLGADVPFCLLGGLARAEGVGERLTPLAGARAYPLVLFTPGGGLSTPEVFRRWNEMGANDVRVDIAALAQALGAGELTRANALAHNDLEAPAVSMLSEIGALRERFLALGAPFARMSGSGSTVFAAFATQDAADACLRAAPGCISAHTRAAGIECEAAD